MIPEGKAFRRWLELSRQRRVEIHRLVVCADNVVEPKAFKGPGIVKVVEDAFGGGDVTERD